MCMCTEQSRELCTELELCVHLHDHVRMHVYMSISMLLVLMNISVHIWKDIGSPTGPRIIGE